jgi:methylmalonyl-CoA mutase N-terminal domain/subunit
VNDFTIEEQPPEILYIDESVAQHQAQKLKALKKRRSNEEVARCLNALKRAAKSTPDARNDGQVSSANTMPFIIDCVRAYATVGEICDALREVYGTYEETSIT